MKSGAYSLVARLNHSGKVLNWAQINSTIASRLKLSSCRKEERKEEREGGRTEEGKESLQIQESDLLGLEALKVLRFMRPLPKVTYL